MPSTSGSTSTISSAPAHTGGARRFRRESSMGPRCPHCAGPLVFGEGCNLCPVCGYSSCSI